jgi:hypothetical protein
LAFWQNSINASQYSQLSVTTTFLYFLLLWHHSCLYKAWKCMTRRTGKSNEDEVATPATSSEFMVLTRGASHLDFYAVRKMVVATFGQTRA